MSRVSVTEKLVFLDNTSKILNQFKLTIDDKNLRMSQLIITDKESVKKGGR